MINNDFPMPLWEKTMELIRAETTQSSYDSWFVSARPISLTGNVLMIEVPGMIQKSHIEKRYSLLLDASLKQAFGREIEFQLLLQGQAPIPVPDPPVTMLNQKYSFDTFVIGKNNNFAHAASLAVAELPGESYNPLFIYGGVGLGKTHLLHAIGNHLLRERPNAKVLYTPSEKFTNDLITAIKTNKNVEFRERYRSVDVLLMDDIQFIAGKESVQEELFHTFNTLHDANKQIVFSSDRPPKEIATLEERLRSRFEWGLLADVQPPDIETRAAILSKKAEMENILISNDVLLFMADKVDSNIREIEGSLKRVVAFSNLTGRPISKALAEEALHDFYLNRPQAITVTHVQTAVAEHFGLKLDDFRSKRRHREISYPRQIAMYLCRELTDLSLPRIGEAFGGRDHTTVIHACEKITEEVETNTNVRGIVSDLRRRLTER